jgi:TonB family protein
MSRTFLTNALVAFSLLLFGLTAEADQKHLEQLLNSLPRNLQVVIPEYPPEALSTKVEGEVEFEFAIDIDGRPVDVVITDSRPQGVFDRALLEVVSQWLFLPNFDKLCDWDSPRARQRVWFDLADNKPKISISRISDLPKRPDPGRPPGGSNYYLASFGELPQLPRVSIGQGIRLAVKGRLTPVYPRSMLREGREGYFFLNMRVMPDGSIAERRFSFAVPRGDFEKAILDTTSKWKLETSDGKPPGREVIVCVPFSFMLK